MLHFYYFKINATLPNYIGTDIISAELVCLFGSNENFGDISNKIILIEQADPGYDWLFGQNIAGLITAYGGANSHMAIRSAEFGISAAIGIGEQLYKKFKKINEIQLDPKNKMIRILN